MHKLRQLDVTCNFDQLGNHTMRLCQASYTQSQSVSRSKLLSDPHPLSRHGDDIGDLLAAQVVVGVLAVVEVVVDEAATHQQVAAADMAAGRERQGVTCG